MSDQSTHYESQLPKKIGISKASIFNYSAGTASLLGIITSPFIFPNDSVSLVYSIFLIFLVSSLLVHTYLRDKRKLTRYAQAIFYIHYVNHIVRDHLSEIENGNFQSTQITLYKIVNSIAQCYSLLTSKQCRCTIKELNDDFTINDAERDEISKNSTHMCNQNDTIKHTLDENTDFRNLWYSLSGCSRYFHHPNLLNYWKLRKYNNSSFRVVGDPKLKNFWGYSWVSRWPLQYKSTIVLPIRYFSEFNPPKPVLPPEKLPPKSTFAEWKFWGFLCIDCNSRNIFDPEFAPELGAAFADILYIFLTQTKILLDNRDQDNIKIIKKDTK